GCDHSTRHRPRSDTAMPSGPTGVVSPAVVTSTWRILPRSTDIGGTERGRQRHPMCGTPRRHRPAARHAYRMSDAHYLVGLDLRGRRVVVVGAGSVAQRRLPRLLRAGADVDGRAPDGTPAG